MAMTLSNTAAYCIYSYRIAYFSRESQKYIYALRTNIFLDVIMSSTVAHLNLNQIDHVRQKLIPCCLGQKDISIVRYILHQTVIFEHLLYLSWF